MCVKITLAHQTVSLPTKDQKPASETLPHYPTTDSSNTNNTSNSSSSMDMDHFYANEPPRAHVFPPMRLVLKQNSSIQRTLTRRSFHCSFLIPSFNHIPSEEHNNIMINTNNLTHTPHGHSHRSSNQKNIGMKKRKKRRRVGFPWDVPIYVSVKPCCHGRRHSDIHVINVWVHPSRESCQEKGGPLMKFDLGFEMETPISSGNGEVPMTVTVMRKQRWFIGQMRVQRLSVSEILRQTVNEECSKLCQRSISTDVWSVIYSYSPSQFWTLGEPSLFVERPLSDLGVPSGMIALNSRWKRALIIQSGWPSKTDRCRVKISDLWSVGSLNDDQINQEFGGISLPVQIRPMPKRPSTIWYI